MKKIILSILALISTNAVAQSSVTKIWDGSQFLDITAGQAAKVDGSAVTQPVSGTITCNAGTNLNTSTLATEATLSTISTTLANVESFTGDTATDTDGIRSSLNANIFNTMSKFHLVSAASTNATNIKASLGKLCGYYIYNGNAAMRKVALHNTAGTPTAGASVYLSFPIPGGSAANVYDATCAAGIPFSSGIGITTVTEAADSGSTGVGADDLVINIYYK